MRSRLTLTVPLLVLCSAGAASAQSMQLPVCKSRDKAQMVMQSTVGATLPEGCRQVAVRRMDTPAGPVCVIEFGQQHKGVLGAVRDAVANTDWWTACGNLRAP